MAPVTILLPVSDCCLYGCFYTGIIWIPKIHVRTGYSQPDLPPFDLLRVFYSFAPNSLALSHVLSTVYRMGTVATHIHAGDIISSYGIWPSTVQL